MKFKTYLIATSALCASSAAFAADMPVAPETQEPIEYVKACNAQGDGYFQLPGSATCIKVGGYIRTLFTSHNLMDTYGVTTEGKDAVTRLEGKTYDNDEEVYHKYVGKFVTEDAGTKYFKTNADGHLTDLGGTVLEIDGKPATPADYDHADIKNSVVVIVDGTVNEVTDEEAVEEKRNDYSNYTRFLMSFTSITETDIVTIKTYTEFYATLFGNTGEDTWSYGYNYANLDFGGVEMMLGYYASLYYPFYGYTGHYNALPLGLTDTWQARLTVDLGNSATFAVAVEDSNFTGGPTGAVNFTSALSYDLAPMSVGLMGGINSYDEDNYGYAISGYVSADPTDRFSLGVGASYAENAIAWLTYLNPAGFENGDLKGYNVFAGASYQLTDQIYTALDGGYTALTVEGEDYDIFGINANVTYEPVDGLLFMVETGMWSDSKDNESANVVGRIQFTF